MKTTLTLFVLGLLVVSALPSVLANDVGIGITPDIITEDFEPLVFQCGDRITLDDATEPGRITGDGEFLLERMHNYAFEGEQISWTVLVVDKNGFEKITDVYGTVGSSQGTGNDIEVNCDFLRRAFSVDETCNARILEEELTGDLSAIAGYWQCTLTVETADSMYGEYWVTVEAEDNDGLLGAMDENEYWFFNPIIALSIDGSLTFDNVRPGTSSYSETLLVGNDAEDGSGVMMDMFISGTDFYDSSSSGAMCPTTNQLSLGAFNYFASQGSYTTQFDPRSDLEGYVPIAYGIGFNNPNPFYGNNEIIHNPLLPPNFYHPGNILSPGSELALTFRLNLPEPCNGDFDTGAIYFWGEAI